MQPTRRQVLRGGAALTAASLSACTADRPPTRPQPSADDRLRAEAVAREQALVEAYLAALHAHPGLARRLTPVLGDHTAHLAALEAPQPASPTPSPTLSPPPSAQVAPPKSVKATLAALVAQERAAAAAHAQAALAAESALTCGRTLSPVLASLAASEASHAAVLA